jgi:hypothetical protein
MPRARARDARLDALLAAVADRGWREWLRRLLRDGEGASCEPRAAAPKAPRRKGRVG